MATIGITNSGISPECFVTEAIEGVQVLIVVVYCETKVLLVLFSDRLLDLTRRGRSR